MSVDFERIVYGRKSQSLIDNFLDETPNLKEERAEALAERTIYNYQSHATPLPHSLSERSINKDYWWLTVASARNDSAFDKWRNALLFASYDEPKTRWQTTELKELKDKLIEFNLEIADSKLSPTTAPQRTQGAEPTKTVQVVSLGRMHAAMWVGLVLFALFWGIVAGAAFFAGAGATPSVATFGVLGTIALSVTLYMLSVQNALRKYGK